MKFISSNALKEKMQSKLVAKFTEPKGGGAAATGSGERSQPVQQADDHHSAGHRDGAI